MTIIRKLNEKIGGYRSAEHIVSSEEIVLTISAKPLQKYKYIDGKRTEEIIGYGYSFSVKDSNDLLHVKFDEEQKISQWDRVYLIDLECFTSNDNKTYFRAKGVKHAK